MIRSRRLIPVASASLFLAGSFGFAVSARAADPTYGVGFGLGSLTDDDVTARLAFVTHDIGTGLSARLRVQVVDGDDTDSVILTRVENVIFDDEGDNPMVTVIGTGTLNGDETDIEATFTDGSFTGDDDVVSLCVGEDLLEGCDIEIDEASLDAGDLSVYTQEFAPTPPTTDAP